MARQAVLPPELTVVSFTHRPTATSFKLCGCLLVNSGNTVGRLAPDPLRQATWPSPKRQQLRVLGPDGSHAVRVLITRCDDSLSRLSRASFDADMYRYTVTFH